MDFELNSEQKMLSDMVYKFMQKEVAPLAEEIDRKDKLPEGIWQRMGELGFLGATVPEKYGGSGFDLLSSILIGEQMARISSAVAMSWVSHAILCADTLYRHANEAQRENYLPKLCSGEHIGALALTEPNAGSDAVSIQTRAAKKGAGYYISGTKIFITNGPIADVLVTYTKTDKTKGAKGITAFIIEKNFPGFSVAKKLDKMCNRGSPTGELIFEDCRVPEENLLGEENRGIAVMMSGLDRERVGVAVIPVGIAQGAFELSLKYAKERVQFGQPIGNFQLIQAKLADMYVQIEAARLLTYKAAVDADQKERGGKGTKMHKVAAAALLLAGEVANKVTCEAVQIHGGYGLMLEFPINRFYRDAKLFEIGAGTSEIRRLLIARELLGE